jgi:hypothetical protein
MAGNGRRIRNRRACAQAEAAEKRTDLNFEALEPFRRAWLQTNSIGRLALEVRVLAYLRMQKLK